MGKGAKRLALLTTAALAAGVAAAPADAGRESRAAVVGAKVKVVNFAFVPRKAKVEPGEKVKWKVKEGTHTVTFKGSGFDKTVSAGDTVSRKFKSSGSFKYFCRFHRDLGHKGKVIVG